MSTRSAIITQIPDGFLGVYCHFDGYPEGVGRTLQDHYQDQDKIRRLVELGTLSSLGERVEPIGPHSYKEREEGTTLAYGRDRGEDDCEPTKGATVDEVSNQLGHDGHVYVFWVGVGWEHNGEPLEEVLAKGDG